MRHYLNATDEARASSALRNSGDANYSDAKELLGLGNITLAKKYLEDARLDYKLAHKLDDDYWGDLGPPILELSIKKEKNAKEER